MSMESPHRLHSRDRRIAPGRYTRTVEGELEESEGYYSSNDDESGPEDVHQAFLRGDVEASVRAHRSPLHMHQISAERHRTSGRYLKSVVYGGLDGIITTFAIVAGVAGASLSATVIIVIGIANLIADGLSMGVGDYLSSRAENDYALAERAREQWEYRNYLDGEQLEMIELLQRKGVERNDAMVVVGILSRYPEPFIDWMMVEELGLLPQIEESPIKNGIATFLSFCICGALPLLVFVIFIFVDVGHRQWIPFAVASTMTGITMFVLGASKTKFTGESWLKGGLLMLVTGGIAASAAYLIGWGLDHLFHVSA